MNPILNVLVSSKKYNNFYISSLNTWKLPGARLHRGAMSNKQEAERLRRSLDCFNAPKAYPGKVLIDVGRSPESLLRRLSPTFPESAPIRRFQWKVRYYPILC